MSSPSDESSVARAVANVLRLFFGNEHVACGTEEKSSPCRVFSYREDFDYLWEIDDYKDVVLTENLDQATSIVLVYDGIPATSRSGTGPDINVARYITAYDWAIHFFLTSIAEEVAPDIRLFFLDVTSQKSDSSFAAQRFPGLLPLLPWIRVYRLFNLTDLQDRFGHFGVGFTNMVAELAGGNIPSLREADQSLISTAEKLAREAWVNNLTRPGGRHDVSNLVAPLVLAEGLGRKEEVVEGNTRRAALARLLQTLGVLEREQEGDKQVSSPLDTPMVRNNIFGQFDHVRFLLVDDQADLGYHDVLASLLFDNSHIEKEKLESTSADGRFSLRSIADPTPLVESLFDTTGVSENSEEVAWSRPRVLCSLKSLREDKEEFDVLLLDLRLFGESNEVNRSEDDFLEHLLEFYDQSGAENIDDDSLDRVVESAREVKKKRDASALMHLALLPLLLSYVDPSLPIVLFSSTRQQAVIEAVAHRPNIITSFHKPVISGYGEEMSAQNHMVALSDAITDALRLHEARSAWQRLVNLEWKAQPAVKVKTGKNQYELFNVPEKEKNQTILGPIERYSDQELPVGLTSETVRSEWAANYQKYILSTNFNDFASLPWEYFEKHFTPVDATNGAVVPYLNVIGDSYEAGTFNNPHWPYHILQKVRHKKSHGSLPPPNTTEEQERYRIASILLFHIFADWISVVADFPGKRRPDLPDQKHAWIYIRDVALKLDPHSYSDPWSPKNMTSLSEVDGLDYLLYTSIYYWNEPDYQKTETGSLNTANVLAKICRKVWGLEKWEPQQIPQEEQGISGAVSESEDDASSTATVTRYAISLGKEGSVSQAEEEVANALDPTPDDVNVRKDENYDLLFAQVTYEDPEEGLKAYRGCDGEIVYRGKTKPMTEM